MKTQISAYRNGIKALPTNGRNSNSRIKQGDKIKEHKALRYFNLAEHEKQDVNARDRQRIKQDKTHRNSFDPILVIEKSRKLIDSKSYTSKVAGLYLLTGRRHKEILITGKFDQPIFEQTTDGIISDWLKLEMESALFSGQVKRKGNDDKPYNVPLLAPLELIQDTIQWLRINKPHKIGERPRGSKELGSKVRKEFEDTGLLPIPNGKVTYLNPHNLRSAYAAICWQLYRQSDLGLNCTEDIFVKAIMGHLEASTESAQSYLDYELSREDAEKLKDS